MLSLSQGEFLQIGQFPRGIGPGTLVQLEALRLAEASDETGAPSKRAWRISDKGREVLLGMKLEPVPMVGIAPIGSKNAEDAPLKVVMRCCCPRKT